MCNKCGWKELVVDIDKLLAKRPKKEKKGFVCGVLIAMKQTIKKKKCCTLTQKKFIAAMPKILILKYKKAKKKVKKK